MKPPFEQPAVIAYSALLAASFERVTGRALMAGPDLAWRLFHAPFALVAHDAQDDPVFCYANRTALDLWGMGWDEFTAMPSRLSAEPMLRADRERLLKRARRQGYVDDYEGVRIAKDGRRFMIRDTLLWTVVDAADAVRGQACVIGRWQAIAG